MMLQLEKQIMQPIPPTSDPTFEAWMKEVDEFLLAEAMVNHHDLADQTYRDWFDSGMAPAEAAIEALNNEGFYDFMDL